MLPKISGNSVGQATVVGFAGQKMWRLDFSTCFRQLNPKTNPVIDAGDKSDTCFDKDYLIVLQTKIYLYSYLFYIISHIIYLYKNAHTYHHTWLHDQQQKATQKTQAIPKRAFFEAMFGSVGRRLTPQVPVGMGFEWSSRGFLKVDRFMKWPLGTAILSKYMGI